MDSHELRRAVEDVVYPALDAHDLGDVALFFACRHFEKTYREVSAQTGLPVGAISRRVGRVERNVRRAWDGEPPATGPSHDDYPDQFVADDGAVWTRIPEGRRARLGGDFAFEFDDAEGEDYATLAQMALWAVTPAGEA